MHKTITLLTIIFFGFNLFAPQPDEEMSQDNARLTLLKKFNNAAGFMLNKLHSQSSVEVKLQLYQEFIAEKDSGIYFENMLDLYFFYFLYCLGHWDLIKNLDLIFKRPIFEFWRDLELFEKRAFLNTFQCGAYNPFFMRKRSSVFSNFNKKRTACPNLELLEAYLGVTNNPVASEKVEMLALKVNIYVDASKKKRPRRQNNFFRYTKGLR